MPTAENFDAAAARLEQLAAGLAPVMVGVAGRMSESDSDVFEHGTHAHRSMEGYFWGEQVTVCPLLRRHPVGQVRRSELEPGGSWPPRIVWREVGPGDVVDVP